MQHNEEVSITQEIDRKVQADDEVKRGPTIVADHLTTLDKLQQKNQMGREEKELLLEKLAENSRKIIENQKRLDTLLDERVRLEKLVAIIDLEKKVETHSELSSAIMPSLAVAMTRPRTSALSSSNFLTITLPYTATKIELSIVDADFYKSTTRLQALEIMEKYLNTHPKDLEDLKLKLPCSTFTHLRKSDEEIKSALENKDEKIYDGLVKELTFCLSANCVVGNINRVIYPGLTALLNLDWLHSLGFKFLSPPNELVKILKRRMLSRRDIVCKVLKYSQFFIYLVENQNKLGIDLKTLNVATHLNPTTCYAAITKKAKGRNVAKRIFEKHLEKIKPDSDLTTSSADQSRNASLVPYSSSSSSSSASYTAPSDNMSVGVASETAPVLSLLLSPSASTTQTALPWTRTTSLFQSTAGSSQSELKAGVTTATLAPTPPSEPMTTAPSALALTSNRGKRSQPPSASHDDDDGEDDSKTHETDPKRPKTSRLTILNNIEKNLQEHSNIKNIEESKQKGVVSSRMTTSIMGWLKRINNYVERPFTSFKYLKFSDEEIKNTLNNKEIYNELLKELARILVVFPDIDISPGKGAILNLEWLSNLGFRFHDDSPPIMLISILMNRICCQTETSRNTAKVSEYTQFFLFLVKNQDRFNINLSTLKFLLANSGSVNCYTALKKTKEKSMQKTHATIRTMIDDCISAMELQDAHRLSSSVSVDSSDDDGTSVLASSSSGSSSSHTAPSHDMRDAVGGGKPTAPTGSELSSRTPLQLTSLFRSSEGPLNTAGIDDDMAAAIIAGMCTSRD